VRILVIVHLFPPQNMGGTEVYAYKLAKALQARGHDVHVFYTSQAKGRANYELVRGVYDGLPCFEAPDPLAEYLKKKA
jgi:glycosyltransferase involved in cell wall biosynthesis